MFIWKRDMDRLDIGPDRVLRLFRSLSDVQIALPGLPAQETTAYLIAYRAEKGVRIAVAFDFDESRKVAFYLNDSGDVSKRDAARVLEEGVSFAESMGFMLGDMDYQQMAAAEQVGLWTSLPLATGYGGDFPAPESPPEETAGPPAGSPSPPQEIPPELTDRCRKLVGEIGRFLASF